MLIRWVDKDIRDGYDFIFSELGSSNCWLENGYNHAVSLGGVRAPEIWTTTLLRITWMPTAAVNQVDRHIWDAGDSADDEKCRKWQGERGGRSREDNHGHFGKNVKITMHSLWLSDWIRRTNLCLVNLVLTKKFISGRESFLLNLISVVRSKYNSNLMKKKNKHVSNPLLSPTKLGQNLVVTLNF